jgi:hypothetical protein
MKTWLSPQANTASKTDIMNHGVRYDCPVAPSIFNIYIDASSVRGRNSLQIILRWHHRF